MRTLVLAVLALAACGDAAVPAGPSAPAVGTRLGNVAPALSGTSLDGHPISLSSWRGSVAVVIFWASWCTPCQAEQPALNALARQEMPAVHFAGVSVDATASAAQAYEARYGVPYQSLFDTNQEIAVRFEVVGPPITYVIDGSGRVAAAMVGQLNVDELRAVIRRAQTVR